MKNESSSSDSGAGGSDNLNLRHGSPPPERAPGAWLIAQAIRYLHADNADGIAAYQHVVKLLKARDSTPADFVEALSTADSHDITLRWALLYVLADTEHPGAAQVFLKSAAERLPERPKDHLGCSSIRDGEILVRTMAIAGLARVPSADESVTQGLFMLLRKIEEPELRVDIVKALLKLNPGNGERIRELLPESQRFMLYLRCADPRTLTAEPDRSEVKERLARAPRLDQSNRAPLGTCDCKVT